MTHKWLMHLGVAAVLAIGAAQVRAQDDGEPLPSLDELLGLESDDAAPDAVEQELESELESGGGVSDAFLEAVDLMGESASRLAGSRDTGVVTQRIQEDILRRLEQLIEDAQQGSGSSGSGSSGQQSQRQNQSQPNQGQQQPQQQSSSSPSGEPSGSGDGPAGQDARPGEATLNTAAWGALPSRLRDALLQGSAEGYSSMYRSLTESYYRRLAEEASE